MAESISCSTCGTRLRAAARFCDVCGAPVAGPTTTAEYKHVTVLFADVVQSMHLAARLDVERYREIITELLRRSADVVASYGGTVEVTGDGVMAVFGAPVAVEDHAVRACRAALDLQTRIADLRDQVSTRDGETLLLRIGINSGRVIAGGAGDLGYRATGEHVGYAQRMESIALPGGVTVSASTAALVADVMELADVEWVAVKGRTDPVPVHRLLGTRADLHRPRASATQLVGRQREVGVVRAALDDVVDGAGRTLYVVGAPGIGKSRLAREATAAAHRAGFGVLTVFCDSHAGGVSFHTAALVLRTALGIGDADDAAARARIRDRLAHRGPEDHAILDGLLGIAAPEAAPSVMDPDARRRRLAVLVDEIVRTGGRPTLVVVEDAHWIDDASDALLADALVGGSSTLLLVTARPEYRGSLAAADAAVELPLEPLDASAVAELWTQLVGVDESVRGLAAVAAARAAGNPFFLEEIVRDLVQRNVLVGVPGELVTEQEATAVNVPATVQTLIEARLDRLPIAAKNGVYAVAVIGMRFTEALLAHIGADHDLGAAVRAEVVEQELPGENSEYSFRHPLIHAVAYESQLRSDRARWHRRIAEAIEAGEPAAVEANAGMIAEHLLAAGDAEPAYSWLMRAGMWAAQRDLLAARRYWDRAQRVADALPASHPQLLALRIAPRTMLSATDYQAHAAVESHGRFAELQELCELAGDKVSLVIGMTARASELSYGQRAPEAARLASEQVTLLESIGDSALSCGLSFVAYMCWHDVGDFESILRWSQTVIDLADGDYTLGGAYGISSPLAFAYVLRGLARCWLGMSGWRDDFEHAVSRSAACDATTRVLLGVWSFGVVSILGVVPADARVAQLLDDGVCAAHESGSDLAVLLGDYSNAAFNTIREDADTCGTGLRDLLRMQNDLARRYPSLLPLAETVIGAALVRGGEVDAGLERMRVGVAVFLDRGRRSYGMMACGLLIVGLLERGTDDDVREAGDVWRRMRALWPDGGPALFELWLLRTGAMLARARGDAEFDDLRTRYRDFADALGYENHIEWAAAMSGGAADRAPTAP